MLPPEEAKTLIAWVQEGAGRPCYEKDIKPMLDARCMACHDGSNPQLPNLNGYDNLKKVAEKDIGADVFTLVRVSHIRLFGLTFIFFITGLMYSHAYVRPMWLKCTIIALPFAAIIVDVSAWYLNKLYHPFAWAVMAAGGLMAVCFGLMWILAGGRGRQGGRVRAGWRGKARARPASHGRAGGGSGCQLRTFGD